MFLYEELNRQRSEFPGMLIRQVELPVSDAVQAARFYGDVLGLPTRTGGGVVQVEVGPSVLLLHPGPVERARITPPSPSPKTALLRQRPGCRSAFHF
jgi:catechol 2,3-dioxygenase-like lactoylglutathione lyase family enzyme